MVATKFWGRSVKLRARILKSGSSSISAIRGFHGSFKGDIGSYKAHIGLHWLL